MPDSSPAAELRRRLAAIERYDADVPADNSELAPVFIALLDWMSEFPDESGDFEGVFLETVDRNVEENAGRSGIPPGVLEFCLHTLRYPRVRQRLEAIHDLADENTPTGLNTRRWVQRVLDAYDDDWEDVKIGLWPVYPAVNRET